MSVQVVDTVPAHVHASKDNVDITVASLPSSGASTPQHSRLLIQSPYSDADHLLDLDTLDRENALLARALTVMHYTREDYATAPYEDSFNWDDIFMELKRLVAEEGQGFNQTSFYVVAFRSQIKAETDTSHLGALDKAAHAEAVASGGFLK